jgi:hypothetical protein
MTLLPVVEADSTNTKLLARLALVPAVGCALMSVYYALVARSAEAVDPLSDAVVAGVWGLVAVLSALVAATAWVIAAVYRSSLTSVPDVPAR